MWSRRALGARVCVPMSACQLSLFSREGTQPVQRQDLTDRMQSPHVQVVNVGTNDQLNPTTPGPLETMFQSRYLDLVRNSSHAYGGKATYFLACGPMSEAYCPYVHAVIAQLTSEDIDVHFLDQSAGSPPLTCCGHPSTAGDVVMANVTVAAIKSVMGW